jgi:iron complex outermembrane receptor protein
MFILMLMAFTCILAVAQKAGCNLVLKGHVTIMIDSVTSSGASASVSIPTMQKSISADSAGNFVVQGLCPGKIKLVITYEGYKPIDTILNISTSIKANFALVSNTQELKNITVKGQIIHKDQITTAVKTTLSGKELDETRGLSLGESLKAITGLNSLQSGPSISKPVIHGVYGNRVLIMNNGVRQEGQTWGNDHAPEIDPFIATNITVIKGAASIRYGSDAIGGVILLDPKAMPKSPGVDGEINIVGMTNGQTGVASGMVEGAAGHKLQGLSWRLQGTFKQAGNAQAADYYLANTGFKEDDYSATLNYTKSHHGAELYYSRFDTKIGIALASVAESETDFIAASKLAVPPVTGGFTDTISRPYQTVTHQLVKASAFVNLPGNWGKIEGIYAYQWDVRKEYDLDPPTISGTTNTYNIPNINFSLNTATVDLIWQHPAIAHKIEGSMGVDFISHGNTEQGDTYQALIPDYQDYGGGLFVIEKLQLGKWVLEAGARYDYRWLQAYLYNGNTVIEQRPTYNWKNPTLNAGASYRIDDNFSWTLNFGTAWRPPQAIELFANGVHQSAASWQIGDSSLTLERAYNTTTAVHYNIANFEAEVGLYANYFKGYIYAKPDSNGVQTNDGYFPAFTYTQAKTALFTGVDLNVKYTFLQHFLFESKSSIVTARDLNLHQWLIGIPSNRFSNTLRYTWPSVAKLKSVFIGITNLIVGKQNMLPPQLPANNGDAAVYNILVSSPSGYMLWGGETGCSIPFGHQFIDISFTVTNLTNVAYRDYLDEFRYYVNDLGRNFVLRVKVPLDFGKSQGVGK